MDNKLKSLKLGVNELIQWLEQDLSIRILSGIVYSAAVVSGNPEFVAKLEDSLCGGRTNSEKLTGLKELLKMIENVEISTKIESLV